MGRLHVDVWRARWHASMRQLNPDTLYQLPSSRLVVVYVMCVSVIKNTWLTCVREPHEAVGPTSGAGGGGVALRRRATLKTPIKRVPTSSVQLY